MARLWAQFSHSIGLNDVRCALLTLLLCQAIAGALEFGEAVDPVLLSLAVLGDDFGGGVLDKGFAGELAGDFFDFGFDFGNLSFEAFFFRGGIDDAFKGEVDDSDIRRTGGMALRSGFTEGEGLRMEQDGEGWCIFWLKGKNCRMAAILTD